MKLIASLFVAFASALPLVMAAGLKGASTEKRQLQDLCYMCDLCDQLSDLCDPGIIADFACDLQCGGGDFQCFSGTTTVQVQGHGSVNMKDLKLGDHVLTADGYQPVYAFGHHNPTKSANFLTVHTDKNLAPLEVTEGHLVYLNDKASPVRADSIKVGDILHGEASGLAVSKIGQITRTGIYAPLTPGGNVVVGNGIVASSYIGLDADEIMVAHHDLIHVALSPFRLFCMGILPSAGHPSNNNDDGMPYYAYYGLRLLQWILQQSTIVQGILLSGILSLTGACMVVEHAFGPSFAPLALAAVGAYFVTTKQNARVGVGHAKTV